MLVGHAGCSNCLGCLLCSKYNFAAVKLRWKGKPEHLTVYRSAVFIAVHEVVNMDSDQVRRMFSLRLPTSHLDKAKFLAEREGISLNHFVSLAIAEKLARMAQMESSWTKTDATEPRKS
jgi:hypothetical protein